MTVAPTIEPEEDTLPAPDKTPFKVEPAESLLNLPYPEWLVDGVIQENTLALVYGPSGCGKSFLALDLAHHLALGRPWFGHEVERQFGVLYIAAEASGGVVKRVKAWRQHHDIAKDTYCPMWFIRTPIDLLEPATVDEVETTWSAWANQFEVVIVDTLSRCTPGGNENAPECMTEAVNNLDRIRERLNATIIVIHHSPLSDKDRPRGHSSLFAAADTAITVEQVGDQRTATVKYQRDGEEGQRFAFSLQQLEVGKDKHMRPVTSCIVSPLDPEEARRGKPLTGHEQVAYDALVKVADDIAKAASDAGQRLDLNRTSAKCPVPVWRQEFQRRQVDAADTQPDTILKRFKRAADSLQSRGIVGFYDDKAWVEWDNRT